MGGATLRGSHEKKKGSKKGEGMFADIKNDAIAAVGEFVATILFLLFALGGVQVINANLTANANSADSTGTQPVGSDSARLLAYFYIAMGFGLSLFGIASIFYRFTGSIMNPSVSLALVLVGVISPVRFVLVSVAQMVGGIVAAAILDGLTPGPLSVGVALGLGTSKAQGLFIEMFVTSALTLSVLMLAAEKHLVTPFAPLMFGAVLAVCELFSVPFTGGAVNTARAFGPACIEGFNKEHWIYWLGPTLGALLATGVYWVLKHVRYWRVNPNQDSTDHRHAPDIQIGNFNTV